jgi:hypothetical protein
VVLGHVSFPIAESCELVYTFGEGFCVDLIAVSAECFGLSTTESFFNSFSSKFLLDVCEGGAGYACISSWE